MPEHENPNADPNPEDSQGTPAEPVQDAKSALDVDELQEQLATWKQNYGRSENERGRVLQELETEKQQRRTLETTLQQMLMQQQQTGYYPDQTQVGPQSLTRDDVRQAIREEVGTLQRQQKEATTRYWNTVGEIKRQPIYANHEGVRGVIDNFLNDPQTQERLMNGQTTPIDVVEKATSQFLMKDYQRLLQQTQGATNLPRPQAVEQGPSPVEMPPTDEEDWAEKKQALTQKQRGGRPEEYTDLAAHLLQRPRK